MIASPRKVYTMRPRTTAVVLAAVTAAALASVTGGSARAGGTPHTHRVVVRPVDAHGHPVAGWTVHRQRHVSVQCDGGALAAVDDGITECFPTAAYLPACWKSQHHTVLCLRDARRQKLVRVRYTGSFGSPTAPRHTTPEDLDLAGGQQCDVRFGGAWSTLPSHPRWLGFYSCAHGSIYGPASGDGIDREHPVWTVHEWRSGTKESVVRHRVATAYYVGTHS